MQGSNPWPLLICCFFIFFLLFCFVYSHWAFKTWSWKYWLNDYMLMRIFFWCMRVLFLCSLNHEMLDGLSLHAWRYIYVGVLIMVSPVLPTARWPVPKVHMVLYDEFEWHVSDAIYACMLGFSHCMSMCLGEYP